MKDVMWLIRKTIRHTFSKPSSWIVYIGLPIATVLLSLMLYGSSSGSTLRIGIVNLDGEQTVTQDAIAFVSGLEEVEVTLLDEASLREAIVSGQVDSGLVFEPGFADSVKNGSPDHLAILSIQGAAVTSYVKSMLEHHIGNIASIGRAVGGNEGTFAEVYGKYKASSFQVDTEVLQDTSTEKRVAYQSIGFLVMLMMFSATNMAEILLKERENRTFLRLMSSPVSARAYVLANVIVNGGILSLQVILMLMLMKWILQHDSGTSFLEMFAALFLFAVVTVGLSLAIAAFSKNRKAFSALTNLIVTPTCLLSGCFFPASIMPDPIQKISHFLPQRWLLDMIEKLQNGQPFSGLFLHTVILLAFSVLFALVAAYRFSRNNDTRQFV